MKEYCFGILVLFIGLLIFKNNHHLFSPVESQLQASTSVQPSPMPDSLISIVVEGHAVDIVYPQGKPRGSLLIFPGWNFPRQDWCEKSSLCREALKRAYVLILPEMGKSLYSSRRFPETDPDFLKYPLMDWLSQKLIPQLQKDYKLLLAEDSNFLMGLSTGGRGVALCALEKPGLFRAGAALSGDFEQSSMPKDRLMQAYYGPIARFPQRWAGRDNPQKRAAEWKIPLYLGHGTDDKVVPSSQTLNFYQALIKTNPQLHLELHLKKAGHDYQYWDAEIQPVLNFFDKF